MPTLYEVECADREDGTPYTVKIRAESPAAALRQAARQHVVSRVIAPGESDESQMSSDLPEPPQVTNAQLLLAIQTQTDSITRAIYNARDQAASDSKKVYSRVRGRAMCVSVAFGIVLSVPLAVAIAFLMLIALAALANIPLPGSPN